MSFANPTRRGLFGLLAVVPLTPLLARGAVAAPLAASPTVVASSGIACGTVSVSQIVRSTILAPKLSCGAITADLLAQGYLPGCGTTV